MPGIRNRIKAPLLYRVEWRARLLLGVVLVLTAAFNRDAPYAVAYTLLASFLVYHIAAGAAPLWAAMRLLRWLVLPILLLHMLLTPGTMITPGLPLPISWEGMHRGVWLSLHLVEMFVAAMALSRLLSWREWLQWLASWPRVGGHLVTDARLFMLMQRDARHLIDRQRGKWRQQQRFDLASLAKLLDETLQQMLMRSELQAARLWRHWDSPRLQQVLAGGHGEKVHAVMTWACLSLVVLLGYRLVENFV